MLANGLCLDDNKITLSEEDARHLRHLVSSNGIQHINYVIDHQLVSSRGQNNIISFYLIVIRNKNEEMGQGIIAVNITKIMKTKCVF